MADIFNITTPPSTEPAKLGAQRIRELKTILNNTLGLIYSLNVTETGSGVPVASCISTTMLAGSSVSTVKIATDAVITAKIADGNVTTVKLENSSGASDGVTAAKIATNAIITSKILDANVTTTKLADNSVTASKIKLYDVYRDHFARPVKWARTVCSVASLTRSGSTVTVQFTGMTNTTSHKFLVGDVVTVSGSGTSALNGTHTITAVGSGATTNTFNYVTSTSSTVTAETGANVSIGSYSLLSPDAAVLPTSSVSGGGTVVTVAMVSPHSLTTGDRVRITGSLSPGFNGEYFVTVTGASDFNYPATGDGTPSVEVGTVVSVQKLTRDITTSRSGVGTVACTFSTAMPDTNYTVDGTGMLATTIASDVNFDAPTISGFNAYLAISNSGLLIDGGQISVTVLS